MQIINKKARLNYQILETMEAGVELTGSEVKSIRAGQVSLDGAHVVIGFTDGTFAAKLIGMHTAGYMPAGSQQIDPTRTRKLLLHKTEILRLYEKGRAKGLAVIPLRIYDTRGWIKMEIGLVKGKKKWEKREVIKKRDVNRDVQREIRKV